MTKSFKVFDTECLEAGTRVLMRVYRCEQGGCRGMASRMLRVHGRERLACWAHGQELLQNDKNTVELPFSETKKILNEQYQQAFIALRGQEENAEND